MYTILKLDPKELLDELRKLKKVKYSRKKRCCVTYLLRPDTNLRDEVRIINKHMGDKYAPHKRFEHINAKKIIDVLRDLEKNKTMPKSGLLILVDEGDVTCYQMPYTVEDSMSPRFFHKFEIDNIIEHIDMKLEEERIRVCELQKEIFYSD